MSGRDKFLDAAALPGATVGWYTRSGLRYVTVRVDGRLAATICFDSPKITDTEREALYSVIKRLPTQKPSGKKKAAAAAVIPSHLVAAAVPHPSAAGAAAAYNPAPPHIHVREVMIAPAYATDWEEVKERQSLGGYRLTAAEEDATLEAYVEASRQGTAAQYIRSMELRVRLYDSEYAAAQLRYLRQMTQ